VDSYFPKVLTAAYMLFESEYIFVSSAKKTLFEKSHVVANQLLAREMHQ